MKAFQCILWGYVSGPKCFDTYALLSKIKRQSKPSERGTVVGMTQTHWPTPSVGVIKGYEFCGCWNRCWGCAPGFWLPLIARQGGVVIKGWVGSFTGRHGRSSVPASSCWASLAGRQSQTKRTGGKRRTKQTNYRTEKNERCQRLRSHFGPGVGAHNLKTRRWRWEPAPVLPHEHFRKITIFENPLGRQSKKKCEPIRSLCLTKRQSCMFLLLYQPTSYENRHKLSQDKIQVFISAILSV